MQETPHIPVLYREVIEAFSPCKEGIVIYCTMGYGGHSSLLLDNNSALSLLGIDQDPTAIAFSTKRLEPFGKRVEIRRGRFSEVAHDVITEHGDKICGTLDDIGVSS